MNQARRKIQVVRKKPQTFWFQETRVILVEFHYWWVSTWGISPLGLACFLESCCFLIHSSLCVKVGSMVSSKLVRQIWEPFSPKFYLPFWFVCWLTIMLIEGASLVAQWLGICLPMQGTRVRALVWEDPTCRGAAGPVSHNYWACASGACAPQQERPR